MKSKDVVAAIIKKDNLYLIAQRNKNKYMGLTWEFPGGKVESNETFHEALSREIQEELNIQINVHKKLRKKNIKTIKSMLLCIIIYVQKKVALLYLTNMKILLG